MIMHQGILWGTGTCTLFSDVAMLLNCFQSDRIRSDFCLDDFGSSRDIQGVFKRTRQIQDRWIADACLAAGWTSTSPGSDTGTIVIEGVDGKFHWKPRGETFKTHQSPSTPMKQRRFVLNQKKTWCFHIFFPCRGCILHWFTRKLWVGKQWAWP